MAEAAPADAGPPTAVPERSGGVHFPGLDAYRAIGMTMVLLNHAAFSTGYISRYAGTGGVHGAVADVVARFDVSVPMFFVLSGFLIYRPFAASALGQRPAPGTRSFLRRRALRVFPGYWAALVGLAVVGLFTPVVDLGLDSVGAWIGNLLALPAFGVPVETCHDGACHVGYGITQAWSIGVELTFYLLLPYYAMATAALARRTAEAGRDRLVVLLAGTGALWLVGTGFRVYVVAVEPSWSRQSLLWLPMFLDLFAIGMALALLSARWGMGGPRLVARLAAHPALCWTAAAALLLVMTRFQPPDEPFGLNGAEYLPRQLVYGAISALWLLPSMFGDQRRGRLRAMLASRPMVWLGGISLSFYLWHLAIISLAKSWTVSGYDDLSGLATFTGTLWQVALVAWVVSVVVAGVVHRAVEVPFLRRK